MIETDKREVYRYLGYRKALPDDAVIRLVDKCLEDLQEAVTPRSVFREYPVQREAVPAEAGIVSEQIPLLRIACMEIRSRSLMRNLRGCESVYLMGTTLGLGPDRLIARASVGQMSRAVVLQAAAAAMIEAWTDQVNGEIIQSASERGLYCRPRFSPGYGDFPLEFQGDLARILRLQKEIGVSLTESLLMMPTKSVTAVVGLSQEKAECALHGCEECGKSRDCAFARNVI